MREHDVEKVLAARNPAILDAFMKADSVLSEHRAASVSISGGADSDIMLDLIERVRKDKACDIKYMFFDTGFEYRATREHISILEQRYGITIERVKAAKTIPACVKEFGQPFLSKYVSTQIERLQKYGFQFEDKPYEVLVERYPDCTSALRWWTNAHNNGRSTFDIAHNAMLKEFLVDNPPTFRISSKCCTYAKKRVARDFNVRNARDLTCIGVRKAEGGVRSKNPDITCFTKGDNGFDTYRPLYWLSNSDCEEYRRLFSIRRSDCYEKWGLTRTGCIGCPFDRNVAEDLRVAELFEPNVCKAARKFFADSYEYTAQFHEYRRRARYEKKVASTDVWRRMFDALSDDPEWSSV